jgi:hypothetical protein
MNKRIPLTSVNDMDEFRGNGQFQMRYVLEKELKIEIK